MFGSFNTEALDDTIKPIKKYSNGILPLQQA
jgi:hypothetical protein